VKVVKAITSGVKKKKKKKRSNIRYAEKIRKKGAPKLGHKADWGGEGE